jgi:hypothetical protein
MEQVNLWRLDEARGELLKPIASKMKLTSYSQIMNRAVDEFIAKHGCPVLPQEPEETEKDRAMKRRLNELAFTTGVRLDSLEDALMGSEWGKFCPNPAALKGFRDTSERKNSKDKRNEYSALSNYAEGAAYGV